MPSRQAPSRWSRLRLRSSPLHATTGNETEWIGWMTGFEPAAGVGGADGDRTRDLVNCHGCGLPAAPSRATALRPVSGGVDSGALPVPTIEARDHVEVLVTAQDGQAMLQGERGDPCVVGRDRTSR